MATTVPAVGEIASRSSGIGKADLSVNVSGLNSEKGLLRYCVTPRGAGFPDCDASMSVTGSAEIHQNTASFAVSGLAPGDYAIAVFHDKNRNNKLDTFAGIPKEGYGFSNNPGFKPRAPRFDEAVLHVSKTMKTEIRLRYIF